MYTSRYPFLTKYVYRSIQCSDTQNEKDKQERRQLDIYNDKIKFTIHVFRKELSHMKTDIDVEFETASPQGVRMFIYKYIYIYMYLCIDIYVCIKICVHK
jgi:hypothetical protein